VFGKGERIGLLSLELWSFGILVFGTKNFMTGKGRNFWVWDIGQSFGVFGVGITQFL